eukprot:TRINITY_DN987_c0_g1_i2.p2 TRINITY_DN987_c0_g1~~TRINITY_DN987_c0_g1_i2.p2  ORF type:complete len:174 (+),score=28.68 TRINITY_DN987_c0_g1_i2:636-1157(+)
MGALGRCGTGAVDAVLNIGIPESHIIKRDINDPVDTPENYLKVDIFINCIYLSSPIQPFFTKQDMAVPGRKLSVVVDVSCDYTSPNNPLPIYDQATTFAHPSLRVPGTNENGNPPVDVCSIDHLPSMLPRESSEAFSKGLEATLFDLPNRENDPVWSCARNLFISKLKEAKNQ